MLPCCSQRRTDQPAVPEATPTNRLPGPCAALATCFPQLSGQKHVSRSDVSPRGSPASLGPAPTLHSLQGTTPLRDGSRSWHVPRTYCNLAAFLRQVTFDVPQGSQSALPATHRGGALTSEPACLPGAAPATPLPPRDRETALCC